MSPPVLEPEARWDRGALLWLVALPLAGQVVLGPALAHTALAPALFLAGALPLCWAALATAATLAGGRALAVRPGPLTGELRALGTLRLEHTVVNEGRWPALCVHVEQEVQLPDGDAGTLVPRFRDVLAPGESWRLAYALQVRLRGRMLLGEISVRVRFPGSLCTVRWRVPDGRSVLLVPARYRLRADALAFLVGAREAAGRVVSSPASFQELSGVRDWRPGDSPRAISWLHSLRSPGYPDDLVVREYEDPTGNDLCLVLDSTVVQPERDEATLRWEFERLVCFTVGMCRLLQARRQNARVLAIGADGAALELRVGADPGDLQRLERALAVVPPRRDAARFDALLRREINRGHRRVVVMSLRARTEESRDRRLPVVTFLTTAIERLTLEVAHA